MDITISLHHAQATNPDIVGRRAADLASINLAKYPIPISFIVPCTFFDEFLAASGIQARIAQIYAKHPQTLDGYTLAFKELADLFHHIKFTQAVKDTFQDAYESLAQSNDAQGLLDTSQPVVTLIPSPTYHTNELNLRQHIKGLEGFINALKDTWLSLYLPEQVLERQQFSVSSFSTGVLVQPAVQGDGIGEGYYIAASEPSITIKTYLGAFDAQANVIGDSYTLAANHLHIVERIIRTQPYRLRWTGTSLLEQALGEQGTKQKFNDRQVLEVARLTKRAHVTLQHDLICYCQVKGEDVIILFTRRLDASELTRTVEESPTPAPQPKDEFIELDEVTSQPMPEAAIPEPVEEVPEQETVEVYEPVEEPVEEPVPAEEPVQEPAFPEAPQQELSEEAPVQEEVVVEQEETLFDMVQQEAPAQSYGEPTPEQYQEPLPEALAPEPEQVYEEPEPTQKPASMPASPKDLIDKAMNLVEKNLLRSYQETFGTDPESYDEMKNKLQREGKMILSEKDMHRIEQAHVSATNDEEIRDKAIGLAWRLLQELS